MYLLVYDVEIVQVQQVSSVWTVVEDWGKGFEMFLHPLPQGPAWVTYVSFLTVYVWTLVMIDDATFVCFGSLSLGLTNRVLRVFGPLKCTWIPLDLHSLLNFSLIPLM